MPSHPASSLLLAQVSPCARLLAWELSSPCAKLHPRRSLLSSVGFREKGGMQAQRQGVHFTKFLLIFRKFTTEPQALKEQCDCHKEQCGKAGIHACAALPHAP